MHSSFFPRRAKWWLTLPLTAALLATLPWLRGYQRAWLAQQAAEALPTLPDAELPAHFHAAAQLADAGVPLLVQALGSNRASASRAAHEVLLVEMARWELLPRDESARRVEILAAELSIQITGFSPACRTAAEDVARRILDWHDFQRLPQAALLTQRCEHVLQVCQAEVQPNKSNLQTFAHAQSGNVTAQVGYWRDEARLRGEASQPGMHLGELPGGGLPYEIASGDAATSFPGPGTAVATAPGLLPSDMSHARPLHKPQDPVEPTPASDRRSAANAPAMLFPTAGDTSRLLPAGTNSLSEMPAARGDASRRETFDLVARLISADAASSQQIEDELMRRGFTAMHLQLARRLTDADPAVRARWAAALPSISSLDARPWLVWLSRDDHAEVRHVALALMATSTDPELVKQALATARGDGDPRIQRLAEQLGKAATR